MPQTSLSVIVSTYNRPDALRAVLEGFVHQSTTAFECIVADDGSGPATKEVVDSFIPQFHGRLKHVWHADEGFRLSAIRNRASLATETPFLCFVDGDCVPRRHFVESHLAIAAEGWISRGSRVLMREDFTNEVLQQHLPLHAMPLPELARRYQLGELNRVHPLQDGFVDVMRQFTARWRPWHWRSVRTCNVVVSHHNFNSVRGFDEQFTGWGFEDSDFCVRMLNAGFRIQRAPAATTVLHLWHRERERDHQDGNNALLQQTLRDDRILPELGLYGEGLSGILPTSSPSHARSATP